MANPDENQPALPWALRPLPLGAHIEVEIEGGWISAEVAEAHGDHQYTLLVHKPDDYSAPPSQPEEGAAAGGRAATAGGGEAHVPGGSAAGPAAAEEDGEESEGAPELHVRIVSDSLLDVADSDDDEGEGGSIRCHWQPAPTTVQDMFSRAVLNLAQRQPLPGGVELPSADQLAAVMVQRLTEVVQRAVSHTQEAGSAVVEAGSVHAALAGMAAELGLPDPVQARMGRQTQAQQQQAPEQQQAQQQQTPEQQAEQREQERPEQQGEEEAEDGPLPGKKARRSNV